MLTSPRCLSLRDACRLLGGRPHPGGRIRRGIIARRGDQTGRRDLGRQCCAVAGYRRRRAFGPCRRSRQCARAPALSQGAGRQARGRQSSAARPRMRSPCFWQRRSVLGSPRILRSSDGDACARLHAASFAHPWPVNDFESLLLDPACSGEGIDARSGLAGFILSRRALDEAEILTIVVDGRLRRQGCGERLLASHLARLTRQGVATLFLEVDESNVAGFGALSSARLRRKRRAQGLLRQTGRHAGQRLGHASLPCLTGFGESVINNSSVPPIGQAWLTSAFFFSCLPCWAFMSLACRCKDWRGGMAGPLARLIPPFFARTICALLGLRVRFERRRTWAPSRA